MEERSPAVSKWKTLCGAVMNTRVQAFAGLTRGDDQWDLLALHSALFTLEDWCYLWSEGRPGQQEGGNASDPTALIRGREELLDEVFTRRTENSRQQEPPFPPKAEGNGFVYSGYLVWRTRRLLYSREAPRHRGGRTQVIYLKTSVSGDDVMLSRLDVG
ncbi:hypothetical protein EYF80_063030 [Liparis tanakae]|uniref:Uncharacterized protein n=1 Tax=Liparis tanakae TaxID=230148 RepID=A0A4Z2EEV4_9TELE|nr:hypothetical protein EYF80_063030 [Liparis tanakae]